MIIRECVWDVCVYISCTGFEGQLGSSFLCSDTKTDLNEPKLL